MKIFKKTMLATLVGVLGLGLSAASAAQESYVIKVKMNGLQKAVATDFVSHTFTNCGKEGYSGPSEAACQAAYAGEKVLEPGYQFSVSGGVQSWTVPAEGMYRLEAWGAQGGASTDSRYVTRGGKGAYLAGDFSLNKGDVLKIVVGQKGSNASRSGGGGGGSYIALADNTPLLVAGGGGGAYLSSYGVPANTSESGAASRDGRAGGTNGSGGYGSTGSAGGGAGFYGNGQPGISSREAKSFINGSNGAQGTSEGPSGGFGGGGVGDNNQGSRWSAGGGGGYSGGAASHQTAGAGGGGSFNAGTNKTSQSNANSGHGKVSISFINN